MLQFMERENMADYNADFLTMLETWDAAVQHLESRDGEAEQPVDIAILLGWTQARTDSDRPQMNRTRAKWISLEWQGADGRVASIVGVELAAD